MAPANETRGEISLSLEGVDYILRPSFEAISAFEAETGFGLLALTGQAEEATMTLDTMASIVTHCIRAHGDATGDQMLKSVNKPKIAALIMGSDGGMLGAIIRVRLLLVMAATGGFSTLTTSAAAVVYGPDGELYNISVPAGIEWRATDAYGDNLSPDRAWTTAAGTVPENALLSVRATTPAIGSKRTTYMITVNGQSFQWMLQTQSTIVMPSVTLATHNVRRTTNNLTGVPNGKKISIAVRFKLASIGVNHAIVMAATGANIVISVSSANRININFRDGASAALCSLQSSATLSAGVWYTLLFSLDLDQATRAEGAQLFLNDVELTSFVSETFKVGTGNLLLANNQQWGFFNNGAGATPMSGEFQWLFLWDDAVNWRDPNQRYRLEPDYLGPKDGSAIYPAKAPAVALWGLATDNGANFGTGGTISNTGTAFVQAVAGSVPADLALEASATGATTVRVAVIGRAKPGVNITATGSVTGALAAQALPSNADDGYVDFTFPSGGQTVTITNSAAYTNPASVTLP